MATPVPTIAPFCAVHFVMDFVASQGCTALPAPGPGSG